MKEDILEQVVEDYFVARQGYFVKHNIKFRPQKDDPEYVSNQDSSFSGIDILAINVKKDNYDKVFAVTCKSWQSGFNIKVWLEALEKNIEDHEVRDYGREKWKYFRELVVRKWTKAFVDEIFNQTGSKTFTYIIACTRIVNCKSGERRNFENSQIIVDRFKAVGAKVRVKVLTFDEIVRQYLERMEDKETNALESTEVGRLLQLMVSSGIKIDFNEEMD